ncbi:hypothetical protein M758_4G057800 [Ceratodon purpureus]|nr:hypothetical protein M758_4G057800 [Ceratodon purpureus]
MESGKSTASIMLVGRERPSGGTVLQESSLSGGVSVRDNIRLILDETGVPRAQHDYRMRGFIWDFSLLAVENTMGGILLRGEPRQIGPTRAVAYNCSEAPPKDFCWFCWRRPHRSCRNPGTVAALIQYNEEELHVLIVYHNVNEMLNINRA